MNGEPRPDARRGAGFSLIELLVALAIAAAVIATAMSAVSRTLSAAARSQGYVEAALIARARLAQAEVDVAEGETAGEQQVAGQRFRWSLVVRPFEMDPEQEPPRRRVLETLEAVVRVEWSDGDDRRSVDATTLLLATPQALQR